MVEWWVLVLVNFIKGKYCNIVVEIKEREREREIAGETTCRIKSSGGFL